MMTMDVKSVPWVGAMCQRFEALCVEVDETIYEDTVEYVGNQMRTAGESVKKFYSEVMQDLLASSSLDSVKDKDALVTMFDNLDAANSAKPKIDNETLSVDAANSAKPMIDNETESVDTASERTVKESPAATNNTLIYGSHCSTDEQCTREDSQNQCADLLSPNPASFVDKDFNYGKISEDKCLSDLSSNSASTMKDLCEESTCSGAWNEWDEAFGCGDPFSKEASAVEGSQSKENKEKITGDMLEGYASAAIEGNEEKMISVGDGSAEINDSVSSIEADVETTITNYGQSSSDLDENIAVSDAGAPNALLALEVRIGVDQKQGAYLSEQSNNSRLEESCVLVENNEHFSKSSLENVQKSCKKKIKEIFFPRRWSKSKKGQEQLAVWYEEQCGKVSTSIRHGELPKSQTSETFESEWELL